MLVSNVSGAIPNIDNVSAGINGASLSPNSLIEDDKNYLNKFLYPEGTNINHKTPENTNANARQMAEADNKVALYKIVAPGKRGVDTIQITKNECETRQKIIENKAKVGGSVGRFVGMVAGLPLGGLAGGYVGSVFSPGLGTVLGAIAGGSLGMPIFGQIGESLGQRLGRLIAQKSACP